MRRTLLITVGMLALAAASVSAQSPAAAAATKLLPGTRAGVLSSIQGNAVTSSNGPLVNTAVRLRDARYGRIVDTVMTDKQGMFAFKGVDPGSYVVEVMNPANNTVMASSQVLNVSTGEAISALVKMPFRIPPLAGLLGNASQTTAQAVSNAAQAVTAAAASTNTVGETLSGVPATCDTWPHCP
jgi:hypothetical protein